MIQIGGNTSNMLPRMVKCSYKEDAQTDVTITTTGHYTSVIRLMSGGDNVRAEDEPILHSSYPTIPMPKLPTYSACELILYKSEMNAAQGMTKWLTNSVTGETLTFADVEPMSAKAASALVKRGMVKGDVAIYMTMNVTKIFTTVLGVWRVGGIMYSSYPEDTEDTLLKRIQDSKAKFVFCDPVCIPQIQSAIRGVSWPVEIIVFGDVEGFASIDELYEDDGADCPDIVDAKLTDPLLVLCTSGTTGKSKGAIYTNLSIMGFCMGTTTIPRTEAPALLLLRCTHVLGVLFPLRNIASGNWGIMMSQVVKTNIFKAVQEYRPNLAFGFPTFLAQMVIDPEAKNYDFSSLECITSGGIILTEKYRDLMLTLPNVKYVMNGYGMTECGALTTTIDLSGLKEFRMIPDVPPLSVGRLYPNTSLKILDTETGKALGPNQRGEIVVKSPIMCSGYWENPEDTATTFVDGWLKTGDLGYYDEHGFVYVVDRIKEVFKYFNNHISPAELEEIFLRHPAVQEATCFGIEDPEGGDHIPRAVTVLKREAQVTPEELQEFVDSQVASFKKIRGGVFIVPTIPRGKTGKVVRSMVATMNLLQGC
ncbi:unnamed protein product [Allacma fusca]|uniref:Uncharacterized protein n=1 Tax=Allacma fusca TaxID=39272 RepID=A0A8J2K001_9HEXA|nr:unnamed protein product [Allacma fusca]